MQNEVVEINVRRFPQQLPPRNDQRDAHAKEKHPGDNAYEKSYQYAY
jgi:hypothetical protein